MRLMPIVALCMVHLKDGISFTIAVALAGMTIGRSLSSLLDGHIYGFHYFICI